MNGDKLTRWTAVAAVLAVAAVAALISYRHCVAVVSAHGEPGTVGRLYPVVIDGLIIAASMVLLDSARHRETAPRLAWWMLTAGIMATLAVNVLAGAASGLLGEIVAAWPAAAFVGCYEVLMLLVRAAARRTAGITPDAGDTASGSPPPVLAGPAPEPAPASAAHPVPVDAESAALLALKATLAAGNPLSQNKLMEKFGLTRAAAQRVRKQALAEANGHNANDPDPAAA